MMNAANLILLAAALTFGLAHAETNDPPSNGTNIVTTNGTAATLTNAPPDVAAAATNATGTDLASFKIISDRNIFNANRSPAPPPGSKAPVKKVIKVNALTLVGTMSSSKGAVAFFDGNADAYRKAVKKGGVIADFTLAEISDSAVQLTLKDKSLKLAVGGQMRQQEEEEWKTTESSEPMPAAESSGGESSKPEAGGDSNEDPVLKRLMEQREKELKK